MPKALSREMKECIASMIHFCERERDEGTLLVPLTAVRECVAAMANVNLSTVSSVWQNIINNKPLSSPKRKCSGTKRVTAVDDATQVAIRNTIYQMYEHHEHITLNSLRERLLELNLFSGCRTSLHAVLKNIGFKYKKDNPRRGLMESPRIMLMRLTFLRSYREYKNNDMYDFVFLDETWIFQNGTIARSWQDENLRSVKTTKVDGKRYIVVHAGNRNGFIPDAKLIFASKSKNTDYHGEMNQENFLKWFGDLLNLLSRPSIIVMDNAPYHSTLASKVPNSASTKAEIKEWLNNNNIIYEESSLKRELLIKVALHKPPKQYVVDKMAEDAGHKVLRLPPYHCNFNPIELVWGICKNYYNRHIGRDGKSIQACLNMWEEALQQVSPNQWANCIVHVEKKIDMWWSREIGFEQRDVAPFIINLNDDSSDELEFSESHNN